MSPMGLTVLGPDVNESFYKFTVNDELAIRFGMGRSEPRSGRNHYRAAKRRKYSSIIDMTQRIDLRAANKALKI